MAIYTVWMADFLFNGLAAGMAIGASLLWQWIRKKTAFPQSRPKR
ncbi:hypothetical protein [Marinifilum fragile]|nr:hypothetical protein [Marinifilum fragile]